MEDAAGAKEKVRIVPASATSGACCSLPGWLRITCLWLTLVTPTSWVLWLTLLTPTLLWLTLGSKLGVMCLLMDDGECYLPINV